MLSRVYIIHEHGEKENQANKDLQAYRKGLGWNKFLFRDQEKEEVYGAFTATMVVYLIIHLEKSFPCTKPAWRQDTYAKGRT